MQTEPETNESETKLADVPTGAGSGNIIQLRPGAKPAPKGKVLNENGPGGRLLVEMCRWRIAEVRDALRTAGNVTVDPLDTADAVRKFKYAVGRNFTLLAEQDAISETKQKTIIFGERNPAFEDYDRERHALCIKHCAKDNKGDPLMKMTRDGNPPQFAFTQETLPLFEAEWDVLKTKYADALREHDEHLRKADAIGDELVIVELYKFPFDHVPVRVNALHIEGIEEMLTGKP